MSRPKVPYDTREHTQGEPAMPDGSTSTLRFLPSQMNALETAVHAAEMGWMVILVGPTASGKTSLIRLLARLTNNTLQEFSMNSAVDATELLGGFEQLDLQRYKKVMLGFVAANCRSLTACPPFIGVYQ